MPEIQFLVLAKLASSKALSMISAVTVAEIYSMVLPEAECSESTLYNAVSVLYNAGYISKGITKKSANTRKSSNTFYINSVGMKYLNDID